MIAKIIRKVKDFTSRFSNRAFVKYLNDSGILVGGGQIFGLSQPRLTSRDQAL